MATPRSRWLRISDLLIDKDWDDGTAATIVRLLCWMRQRWAKHGLSANEAIEGALTPIELARVTKLVRFDEALGRMAQVQDALRDDDDLDGFVCQVDGCEPGVYWVRCGGEVKIGRTLDLNRRLAQIRRQRPGAELVGWEPTLGFVQLEKRLHREFAEWRVRGEWFSASREVIARSEHARLEHVSSSEQALRKNGGRNTRGVLLFSWPKVAKFQGWDARDQDSGRPGHALSDSRRHDDTTPDAEKEDAAEAAPLLPLHPAPKTGSGDQVLRVWEIGQEAAVCYRPTASRWILSPSRRRALQALLRDHPDEGDQAFARVVHGYRYARRTWEKIEDHFEPDTLLRASNRAKYLEGFHQATAAGVTPPFRPDRLGAKTRGRAPIVVSDWASRRAGP